MTFNQMRAFAAVANCFNITRAAEPLGISEPSVFKQLKGWRTSAVQLYKKIGRQIAITREGLEVRADIREMLLRVKRLGIRQSVARQRSSLPGR